MHKLTFRKFKKVENVTVYENGEMILMNLCENDSYVHCKKDGHKILQGKEISKSLWIDHFTNLC